MWAQDRHLIFIAVTSYELQYLLFYKMILCSGKLLAVEAKNTEHPRRLNTFPVSFKFLDIYNVS